MNLIIVNASVHELLQEHRIFCDMGCCSDTKYSLNPQRFIGETEADVKISEADMQRYRSGNIIHMLPCYYRPPRHIEDTDSEDSSAPSLVPSVSIDYSF